jgi:hypothetical protein
VEERMWLIRDKYPEVPITIMQDRLELLEAYSGTRLVFFSHAGIQVWAGLAGFCNECDTREVTSELVRLDHQVPPPEQGRFPGETRAFEYWWLCHEK